MGCAWPLFLIDKPGWEVKASWWAKTSSFTFPVWSMPSQKPQARSTPATIRNESSWWSPRVKSHMHWMKGKLGRLHPFILPLPFPLLPPLLPRVGGCWIWCLQLHKTGKREQQHQGIPRPLSHSVWSLKLERKTQKTPKLKSIIFFSITSSYLPAS